MRTLASIRGEFVVTSLPSRAQAGTLSGVDDAGDAVPIVVDWVAIAERAATLQERLHAYRTQVRCSHREPPQWAPAAWRESAAAGDPDKFHRRLLSLGLQPTDLPQCLSAPDLAQGRLPEWCQPLARAADLASTDQLGSALPPGLLDRAPEALPDLLEPLLAVAVSELTARRPELQDPQSRSLLGDLSHQLQHRLANTVQACVDVELRTTREASERPAGNLWTAWMQEQRADGLTGMWTRYPTLARLVGTTLKLWVARSEQLLHRAATDLPALSAHFGVSLIRLARVTPGLSDPHQGHATVVDCGFSDAAGGLFHVIYKPKDVTAERVFGDVCRWLGEREVDLGASPTVVSRAGYGWVERIAGAPAADPGQVDRYFRRCGMLSVVLFALGGTDCTAENLVAAGDRPVIIDAETILAPTLQSPAGAAEAPESILDALLLPRWLRIGERAVDLSAMGTADPLRQPRVVRMRWIDAGTSDARLEPVAVPGLRRRSDLVDHSGAVQLARDHTAAVLAGFDQAWAALAEHAGSLTGDEGPLRPLAAAPVRVLVRMTGRYERLLRQALAPELLTDGVTRSLHLEVLARYPLNQPDGAVTLGVADAEREQLEIGDVPLFTALGEDRSLVTGDGTPLLQFRESALERARRRCRHLTPQVRERQRDQLRASLAVSAPGIRTNPAADVRAAPSVSSDPLEEVRVAACARLLDRIAAGVEPVAGGYRILGLTPVSAEQWGVAPLDAMFFHGTAGVATALFAAARTSGDTGIEELATAILRPGLTDAVARLDRLIQLHGLGVPRGVGGLRYGWSLCRELATSTAARELLEQGLAELRSHRDLPEWDSIRPEAERTYTELVTGRATGDSLGGGSAGWIEYLRLRRSDPDAAAADGPHYDTAVRELADRVVVGRLRLGVPSESPLVAYGLHDGLAGILYALSAASPGTELPSLLTWRVTD